MALFSTIGSAFGPWGTAAGSVMDYALSEADKSKAADRRLSDQRELYRMAIEQEKASILGRVDAAKAAGLHPLVAMGAQGLGGPVVSAGSTEFGAPMPGFIDLSPKRERVPGDSRTADQKRRDAAEADLAELQVEAARRRLSTQPGNGGAPNQLTGTGNVVPSEATPYPVSHVKIEGQSLPPASMSAAHQTPGIAPGWDVVRIGTTDQNKPLNMVVPGGSVQRENWGEQLGELPIWMWPEIVRQSAKSSKMSNTEWLERALTGGSASEHLRETGVRWEDWRYQNYLRKQAQQPKQERR